MDSKLPIRRLFRIALYTSTAIGLITLSPVYVTVFTIAEALAPQTMSSILKLATFSPLVMALIAMAFISFLVFIFWSVNILFLFVIERYSIEISTKTRYLLSYIFCIATFILFRIVFQIGADSFLHPLVAEKISLLALTHTKNIESMRLIIIALFAISSNTVILIIQDAYLLREKKKEVELENARLKIMNIEATYQQLKQQVHPHFLFNSLNTLKTLIRKQPENAEIYLKKLSDFLRTSISLDNKNMIRLDDELKFCMDYLDLQKIRFGEALEFVVNIPAEAGSGYVPVFSLQQLLENAIKHNAFTRDMPLVIRVEYSNGRIIVTNNLQVKNLSEETTGLGLSNLAERYRIISGDEIVIQTDSNYFSVSLKILDHENSNC